MASAAPPFQTDRVRELTRVVLGLVAGASCVAALAAVVAIVSGDFSDGDWKVIGSSALVALASSTGGAGIGWRLRATNAAVTLGTVVVAASAAAFALVNYGMWVEVDDDLFWRATGVVAIVALDGAHACFVLARRRETDPEAVKLATGVAALAAAISGTFGILAVTGLADDGPWQLLAVVLVIQLLATALAALLRRMARAKPTATADAFGRTGQRDIASELRVIADELDDAKSPAAVHELADRLRRLARHPPDISIRSARARRTRP
jgi:hypothetical protein